MIDIRDITKSYGSGGSRFQVLNGISIKIEDEGFTVITGAVRFGEI